MTSQTASRHAGTPCTLHTVRIWFKSFIPVDMEGTEPVPDGPHAGKTMFRSPGPLEAWFLTDQRGFSTDPNAEARMHSEIKLDLANFAVVRQSHRCDPSIQVDHKTGTEDCHETADTDDMTFKDIELSPDTGRISFHLHGSTKNACLKVGPVKLSPNLDYDGDIDVMLGNDRSQATVTFDGHIETYPAFEMYVSVNGGPPVTVFQAPVEPGSTPVFLAGPPSRAIHESVTISC